MSHEKPIRKLPKDPFSIAKYNLLFEEEYENLCYYCIKFVGDKDSAEDIVQEQFVYLWENWSRLKNIESLKSYLFKAVKNKSINHLKKLSVRNKTSNLDDLPEKIQEKNTPLPSEIVVGKELEKLLEEALNLLPEKCRTIFTLKRFAELSNKEIAEHLQISIKTVEAQMTIAIKKLKAYVNMHWPLVLVLSLDQLLNLF